MSNRIKKISVLIFASCFSAQLLAGTPVLDERQDNQNARIKQGVKSGELTKKEARKLAKGQKQLREMERKAKADGTVTKKERAHLQHKANVESGKIYRNKHDDQDRNG